MLAEACQQTTSWPPDDEPILREAYAFGEVLDGDEPLDSVKVALVLNLPPEEVPWESRPHGTERLVDTLRLDKGGFAYWWRSRHDPVWGTTTSVSLCGSGHSTDPTRTCCGPCRSAGSPTCPVGSGGGLPGPVVREDRTRQRTAMTASAALAP